MMARGRRGYRAIWFAPIALYPDNLLSEVLMASAYPLDIVQAERWLKSHKNLKGDQLKAAIAKEDWDDSVKSLIATPDVLAMMSEKLDWTEKLGDAVVDQQPDVMDAIQRLRAKAQANDKLKSTKQQTVTVNEVQGKQVIAIAPTDPDTVYVPYYDPSVVYGAWPYPDYPPYYWPPPPYIGYGLLAAGLAFGTGWALGNWWVGRLLGRQHQLERRRQQHQHHPARESSRASDRRRRQQMAAAGRPSPGGCRKSRSTGFPRQPRRPSAKARQQTRCRQQTWQQA
jgi:hypothetical protein